jgi:hypothetical protein
MRIFVYSLSMYDISTLPFHSRHRKSSMVIRRIEINVSDVYSPDIYDFWLPHLVSTFHQVDLVWNVNQVFRFVIAIVAFFPVRKYHIHIKRRYQILCTRCVSEITFIVYAQDQKIGKLLMLDQHKNKYQNVWGTLSTLDPASKGNVVGMIR